MLHFTVPKSLKADCHASEAKVRIKQLKRQEIAEALEGLIRSGELYGKLPSYEDLARHYKTSPVTIGLVIKELERQRLVKIKPKSGVTVEPLDTVDEPKGEAQRSSSLMVFISPQPLADPYWGRVADGAKFWCLEHNDRAQMPWRFEHEYGFPRAFAFPPSRSSRLNHSSCPLSFDEAVLSKSMTLEERQKAEAHERQLLEHLSAAAEVNGLLIAPRSVFNANFYFDLLKKDVRIATVDSKIPGISCVTSDNYRAGFEGAMYLLLGTEPEKGRPAVPRARDMEMVGRSRDVVANFPALYVLAESQGTSAMAGRVKGCRAAVQEAARLGYSPAEDWLCELSPVIIGDQYAGQAYVETRKLINDLERAGRLGRKPGRNSSEQQPIAIFALTDRTASGAYQALLEKGYADWSDPEKEAVALLSFDDIWPNIADYGISSMIQNPFAMGMQAAQMLNDMEAPSMCFQAGSTQPDVLLPVGLAPRCSTEILKRLWHQTP
jgi:DNA-binding LacI/PurR family transcriptional regulator/DNA-binding transcriptional regulator YhcF (GntR family)